MNVKMTKIPATTAGIVTDYQETWHVIMQSEAKIARALSRIDRADRIRKTLSGKLTPTQATVMGVACDFEATSYKQLALLPSIRRLSNQQLDTLFGKIQKKL